MKNNTVVLEYSFDGLRLVSAPKGIKVLCRDYTMDEPPLARVKTDADGFQYVEDRVSK